MCVSELKTSETVTWLMRIRRSIAFLICAAVAFPAVATTQTAVQQSLVIRDVTVIDGTGAAPRANRTVIITGDRIAGIGDATPSTVPKSARVVQARGKFLIPGVWDMHVHLTPSALPAFVAYGVTGVRDMGNILSQVDSWRAEIATGTRVVPRIFRVGPTLNGQAFGPSLVAIASDSEARAAVRVLKHVGVDATRPQPHIPEAIGEKIVDHHLRGCQHPFRRAVKPPQPRVAPRERQAQTRMDVFGKPRVVGGCERKVVL